MIFQIYGKEKLKKMCRKKARKKFKKGLNINSKKVLSCGMYIFDRYW